MRRGRGARGLYLTACVCGNLQQWELVHGCRVLGDRGICAVFVVGVRALRCLADSGESLQLLTRLLACRGKLCKSVSVLACKHSKDASMTPVVIE